MHQSDRSIDRRDTSPPFTREPDGESGTARNVENVDAVCDPARVQQRDVLGPHLVLEQTGEVDCLTPPSFVHSVPAHDDLPRESTTVNTA
jgi:hypothetical protein